MPRKPATSYPEVVLLTQERDEILAERDLYRKQLSEALSNLKLHNNAILDLKQQYNDLSSELADVKRKLVRERLQLSVEIVHSQGEEVGGSAGSTTEQDTNISSESSTVSTSSAEGNTTLDGHGVSFSESQAGFRDSEHDEFPRAYTPLPSETPRVHTPVSVVDEDLTVLVSPPMPIQGQVLPFAESGSIKSSAGKLTKEILGDTSFQYSHSGPVPSCRQKLVQLANQSQYETDAQTMRAVVNVIYETLIKGERTRVDYETICYGMICEISPEVQDSGKLDAKGNPIGGGKLYRKLLLERLQGDFEKWVSLSSIHHQASKETGSASADWDSEDELGTGDVQYSAEILRLLDMLGTLSSKGMVPEWVILGCIEKLLTISEAGGASSPVCIEGLCTLLFSAGKALHSMKARGQMDVCFERMRELAWPQSRNTKDVGIDMKVRLRILIDYREREWLQ